jgi:hypothetical protein
MSIQFEMSKLGLLYWLLQMSTVSNPPFLQRLKGLWNLLGRTVMAANSELKNKMLELLALSIVAEFQAQGVPMQMPILKSFHATVEKELYCGAVNFFIFLHGKTTFLLGKY